MTKVQKEKLHRATVALKEVSTAIDKDLRENGNNLELAEAFDKLLVVLETLDEIEVALA